MADFKVRFVGDVGNLQQFDRAIRNTVQGAAATLRSSNTAIVQGVAGGPLTGGYKSKGLLVRDAQTIVDSVNRTFQQSGVIVRRYISDYKAQLNALGEVKLKPVFSDAYVSSFKKNTGDLDAYLGMQKQAIQLEQDLTQIKLRSAQATGAALQEELILQKQLDEATVEYKNHRTVNTESYAIANAQLQEAVTLTKQRGLAESAINRSIGERIASITRVPISGPDFLRARLKQTIDPNGAIRPGRVEESQRIQRELEAAIAAGTPSQYRLRGPGGTFVDPAFASGADLKIERDATRARYDAQIQAAEKGGNALLSTLSAEEQAKLKAFHQAEINLAANGEKMVAIQTAANAEMEVAIRASPTYGVVNGTARIPPQLHSLLSQSPQLFAAAQAQGFAVRGDTIPDDAVGLKRYAPGQAIPFHDQQALAEIIAQQNGRVTNIRRNATKGETNVGVEFENLNKNAKLSAQGVQEVNAALDDNGNIIKKVNSNLSATSGLFQNFGHTLYRTAQFAVTAGLTFGTFSLILNQFKGINELNAGLTRLGTTAGLTSAETRDLFDRLARVAVQTATPLQEIVNSADDVALAVKKAGDSTQEYEANIISLTQAVGILTNLTGIDTVRATDLLSSAFKQLEIAPTDLLGILNKVTAVAGGQSTAIADIIQGIGGIASAAKAGGLSVDQMIGVLKTLSQVTAKSPAEVATAFKNLIGSLASPGSIKLLREFGIEVRTQTGEVRNIIDVYGEISQKIQQGLIRGADVQAVIRAISGGPRRAPDAAALLENIGAVNTETRVAIAATNEALIANARILDTNSAKITQFQAAFDTVVFQEFGKAVQDLVGGLAVLGTNLINIFKIISSIPLVPQFVGAAAAIGGVILAMRVLIGVGNAIGGTLRTVSAAFARVTVDATAAADAQLTFGLAGSGKGKGSFAGALSGRAGLGLGAAIGGGISAATGGDLFDILGGAAGGLAIPALAAGQPEIALAAGAASILIPLLKEMVQGKKQDAQATLSDQQAVIQSIQAYESQKRVIADLTSAHSTLGAEITALRSQKKLDAEDTRTLVSLQDEYAQNTVDLVLANQELTKSFASLGTELGAHKYQVDIIQSGQYNAKQLLDIKNSLAETILRQTNPDFQQGGIFAGLSSAEINRQINSPINPYAPSTFVPPPLSASPSQQRSVQYLAPFVDTNTGVLNPYVDAQGHLLPPGVRNDQAPTSSTKQFLSGATGDLLPFGLKDLRPLFAYAQTFADKPFVPGNAQLFQGGRDFVPFAGSLSAKNVQTGLDVNLEKIASGATSVGEVFDETGKKVVINFEKSRAAIDAVQAGINSLAKTNPALAASYQATWTAAITGISSYDAILSQVAVHQSAIQAQVELGVLSPDEAKKLVAITNLQTQAAVFAQQNVGKSVGIPGYHGAYSGPIPTVSGQIEDAAQKLAANPTSSVAQKEYADLILKNTKLINGQGSAYDDLKAKGQAALRNGEAHLIETTGLTQTLVTTTKTYTDELAKAQRQAELLNQAITQANAKASGDYASRALEIEQNKASGAYKYAPKGRYEADVKQNEAAYTSQKKLNDELFRLQKLNPTGFRELERHFKDFPGLQDAATLSAAEFAERIIQIGLTSGLSADQMAPLIARVLGLGAAIVAVPSYKAIDIVVTETVQQVRSGSISDQGAIDRLTGVTGSEAGAIGAYAAGSAAADKAAAKAKKDAEDKRKADAKALSDFLNAVAHPKLPPLSSYGAPKKPKAEDLGPTPGLLDLSPDILQSEQLGLSKQPADIQTIIANAKKLQSQIPNQAKRDKDSIVEILDGTKRIAEVRGISEELLRKSMEELAAIEKKRLDFDTKADTIRRIRVGSGDFAAIANVPFNRANNLSVGGNSQPIQVNLNINGQILTPAQLSTLGDYVGARLKKNIVAGS